MSVFVDTSALLALLNADDEHCARAVKVWRRLLEAEETLVVSNYILVETYALVQSRLGIEAADLLQEEMLPVMTVCWVDEKLHQAGTQMLLAERRKKLSLVDCVSFAVMRHFGFRTVFTFDRHFREQGFKVL